MLNYQRLSRADFAGLERAKSRRIHGAYFSLTISPLPEGAQGPKFSCVISKKVSLKAVERNLVKRRCREIARSALKRREVLVALVFRAKREALNATFGELGRDVRSLIEKFSDTGYTRQ